LVIGFDDVPAVRQPKSLYTPFHYLIMVMKMAELPIAPITRLVRNAGAERVSEDASQALVDVLEEYGEKVARKAVSLAKHAGRKTVKKEDIMEAVA
jgi:histone H3/H4